MIVINNYRKIVKYCLWLFIFDFDISDGDDDCWPPKLPPLTLRDMRILKHAKRVFIDEFNFPFCADASKFEKMSKVGQGTLG